MKTELMSLDSQKVRTEQVEIVPWKRVGSLCKRESEGRTGPI